MFVVFECSKQLKKPPQMIFTQIKKAFNFHLRMIEQFTTIEIISKEAKAIFEGLRTISWVYNVNNCFY